MGDKIEYILTHGSGNRFILVDATLNPITPHEASELILKINNNINCDGLLVVDKVNETYRMRMHNTDGTSAAMCGNGMRCVARYVDEKYLHKDSFELLSGEATYNITREKEMGDGIPTYGVEISASLQSSDIENNGANIVEEEVAELDSSARFTFLSLGNPHIVAIVDEIDYTKLQNWGEFTAKQGLRILPNGVNISMVEVRSENEIFVATYERGVGLTASCGTAMTASTITLAILNKVAFDKEVKVVNRGGYVYITPLKCGDGIGAKLVGNATYIEEGVIDDGALNPMREYHEEAEKWSELIESLQDTTR